MKRAKKPARVKGLPLTDQGTLHEEPVVIAKPSPGWLMEQANRLGYRTDVLEQVFWLTNLLWNIYSHPFLREKLVLKGGTALNLFWLKMPRLSLDLDFNYIGALGREEMEKERPQIEGALERTFRSLGLEVQKRPEYAGTIYPLRYQGALGGRGSVQVEVNWLMRVCLLKPKWKEKNFWGRRIRALILAKEELMAGKRKAFLEREQGETFLTFGWWQVRG